MAEEHGTPGAGLNAAQARAVRAALTHVSDLLEGVLRIAQGGITPFDRQHDDLTPDEARKLAEVVPAIRSRMLAALDGLGIAQPDSDRSARWTARTAFAFAEIALSEVTPAELAGYGPMDERAAAAVTRAIADIRCMIGEAHELLRAIDDTAP